MKLSVRIQSPSLFLIHKMTAKHNPICRIETLKRRWIYLIHDLIYIQQMEEL